MEEMIVAWLGGALGVIFLALIVLFVLASTFYVVPQQRVFIIERLGKFSRISNAGLHFRIPFVERIAGRLDLRTQQHIMPIDAKTKDNVTISLEVAVQYRVDTTNQQTIYDSFYSLAEPLAQMQSYIADSLRSSIPKYDLDDVFDKKDAISELVKKDVTQTMKQYGYVIASTLIQDIELPPDVKDAMNDINAAQRKKVAAQSLADADKIAIVTKAEAEAKKAEQKGIGIAAQRTAIAEGINKSIEEIKKSGLTQEQANMLFLYTQWTDMMTSYADKGRASTVVLPSDFNQSMGAFNGLLVAQKAQEAEDGADAPKGAPVILDVA